MLGLLDHVAGLVFALQPASRKLFADGWGADHDSLEADFGSVTEAPRRREVVPAWHAEGRGDVLRWRAGSFTSPVEQPERRVEICWTTPRQQESRRAVLLFGAWGEHGFARRLRLAEHLAGHGLSTLMAETPFHGQRRMPASRGGGSPIRTVTEHAVLTRAAVGEGLALLDHLHATGHRATLAGFSMGASHAGAVAALAPRPVAAALFAVGYSTTVPFLDGILRRTIAWRALGGRRDAEPRLRHLLSRISHLELPPPRETERILLAGARSDAYIPARAIDRLAAHWPGAQVAWRPGGHVSMWLFDKPWIARRIAGVAS